jgi:hypothetical protein
MLICFFDFVNFLSGKAGILILAIQGRANTEPISIMIFPFSIKYLYISIEKKAIPIEWKSCNSLWI